MLREMREKTGSLVVKIILGLLVISFGAWGVGDMVTFRAQDMPVAEVEGAEVTRRGLEYEIRRELARLNPQFGNQLTDETARALGIPQSVLGRMINDLVFLDEAGDMRMAVSDDVVSREIRNDPRLKGSLGAGTFDRGRLQNLLNQAGMTEGEYIERVRKEIARSQLIASVESGLRPPKSIADAVNNYREEQRIAETIYIADADAAPPAQPTDAELRAYHKDNATRFTAPEQRALTMIVLRTEDLIDEASVAEEAVKKAFEEQADTLVSPEKRALSQMFLQDKAAADAAAKALAEGRDFADVAKEIAKMDAATTDLGVVTKAEALKEIADAAFSTPEGQVTGTLPGPGGFGFYIVEVRKVEPAVVASLETAAPKLRKALARDRAIDSLYTLVNKLEDELASGAPISEAATALSLKTLKVPAIDHTGGGADGKPLDLPVSPVAVAQAAFETEKGTDSTLREIGDNAFFVLHVDAITPPALRPFETVKGPVLAEVMAARKRDTTLSLARNIADRVKEGQAARALAKEFSAAYKLTDKLKRHHSAQAAGLSVAVLRDVFKLEPGAAAVTRADNGYYVSKLKQVLPPDPTEQAAALEAVEKDLAAIMKDDLVSQFAEALRKSKGVTINQEALRRVLNPNAAGGS